MYDNGRYSIVRFSANREAATVEIAEAFSEAMNAVAGAAIPVEVRERYADSVRGYTQGTVSVRAAMGAAEIMSAVPRMCANVVTGAVAAETLKAEVAGEKNISTTLTSHDSLAATTNGVKCVPASIKAFETWGAAATPAKDIYISAMVADTLMTIMSATTQTTETATVQITIPPGGELRLDSDTFRALLDGENVLYAQAGDWINVSREMLRLIVESATGGTLEGQLIYTERFL
jgi:hypothetical protein